MNGDLKLALAPPLELQLLAAPGQLQAAWLVAEGYSNDELGMKFDDWLDGSPPTMKRDGLIDGRADQATRAIATQLEAMRATGPRLLWTATAELHGAPEWERLRALARPALDALGLPSSGYDVLAEVPPAKMIQALRELLGWLARPAKEQQPYLDQPFAPPVQDLPLTLDDCVTVFVPRLTSAGAVSPAAATAVTAVRDFIRSPAVQADPALRDQATLATSAGSAWTAGDRMKSRTAVTAVAAAGLTDPVAVSRGTKTVTQSSSVSGRSWTGGAKGWSR